MARDVGSWSDTGPEPRIASVITPLSASTRQTYQVAVFNQLRDLIQNLELPPGARLVEADIAARFGVSKTPVREALFKLEREGLISLRAHSGATVEWLHLDEYEQQLFILDALELPALKIVLERMEPDHIEKCLEITAKMDDALANRDEVTYIEHGVRLHTQLFAAARYPRLTELIETVQQSLVRYTRAFVHRFPENWEVEHQTLHARMESLAAGDSQQAAAAAAAGHKAMLEFARGRVAERDERVIGYIAPWERPA